MTERRAADALRADPVVARLLPRCTFPPRGGPLMCALSGGPDSAALVALAVASGCDVTAVHVRHGLRRDDGDDAERARRIAERVDAGFRVVDVDVEDGPNLEARARVARHTALGADAATGHTADDQAETVLLALLRGAGAAGLGAMEPGRRHPILGLRAAETRALCRHLGFDVADDPSNRDPRFRRNRIRADVLPLLDEVAERDVTPLLTRTAALLRDDDAALSVDADVLDPTDAGALTAAPRAVAARAVRRWLELDGYPPDAAAVHRVLAVAAGERSACEVAGKRRVERRRGRLSLFAPADDTE